MNKTVLIALGVLLIIIVAFFSLNHYIYQEKQADPTLEESSDAMVVSDEGEFAVMPVSHASMIINLHSAVVYNDPVGGADAFTGFPEPDVILISHDHGDHFDPDTIQAVATERTMIVMPQVVADKLPAEIPGVRVMMRNGETFPAAGFEIQAVAAYNVPETADANHQRGVGNGYVLDDGARRIYIAGDTGPTDEMKALADIDHAFIPMNLPYTMSVEDAAGAVISMKPGTVTPYHYRMPEGLSDIDRFREFVTAGDPAIQVDIMDFYPGS